MQNVTGGLREQGVGQQLDGRLNVTLFDQVVGLVGDVDDVLRLVMLFVDAADKLITPVSNWMRLSPATRLTCGRS